jgi:signal transduction histidine kinase
MWRKDSLPRWLMLDGIGPVLLTGLLLFLVSYAMSHILDRLGMGPASTILDDLAIAILAALLLRYYLSASRASQSLARAKERIILVAELNHHIRNALVPIGFSATLDDQQERLRIVDEAIERIDQVLTDLVPTVGSAESPRFFLPVLR